MNQQNLLSGPLLSVRHGATWPAEHRYILDVLLGEHLGLRYQAEPVPGLTGVEIRCPEVARDRVLSLGANLLLQPAESWLSTRVMPALPLANWEPGPLVPAWDLGALPVLYPPLESPSAGAGRNGTFLPVDLLGGAFFLLTRYEELVLKQRDRHQRFPAAASVAVQGGFLSRPLVDEYAELLRMALQECFPGLPCRRHPAQLRLSHDIDHPFQFVGKSLPRRVLSAGRRLCRQPRLGEAWRGMRAALRPVGARCRSVDPFDTYDSLMDASESLNTPGEFYFMAGTTNQRYEEPYDLLQPQLQELLRRIHSRGHTLGLHSSYDSFRSEAVLGSELHALRFAAERAGIQLDAVGGRQHYLRWVHPTSWRCWDQVGLRYDASLGFPEQVGFRCGTAREFPVFDPTGSRPLRLRERPLIAMDVTLTEYMGLSWEEMVRRLESLWASVKRVGGSLEVLIHNCNPCAVRLARAVAGLNIKKG